MERRASLAQSPGHPSIGATDGIPGGQAAAAPLDRSTFAALYEPQATPVYRYFFFHLGNVPDAEDLRATTARKALESLDRFDPARGTFGAWLFAIARHTLRDFKRRRRPSADIAALIPPLRDPAPLPEADVERREQADALHRLILRLPPAQREALMLRYFASLHIAEIAAALGRSEGAVNLLLHRALTTLRAHYRPGGHE